MYLKTIIVKKSLAETYLDHVKAGEDLILRHDRWKRKIPKPMCGYATKPIILQYNIIIILITPIQEQITMLRVKNKEHTMSS